jgi:membrane-associated protease RseP (regulator of RpoE activity)
MLSLPLVVSQQLSVTRISGADEVDGYARRGDVLSVVVTAAIFGNPPDDIARTRVRLYSDSTRFVNFDSCTKQAGNFYDCTLTDDEALRNVIGVKGYEVRLLDADGNTLEKVGRTVTVDNQEPFIRSFEIDPEVSTSPTATFAYEAEDYGFSSGDTSDCSGIKEVQFIVDGVVIASKAGSIQECVKKEAFTHTFAVNGTASFDVCAQATDFFDRNSRLVCDNFRVDTNGPRILSADVVSSEGFRFTHVRDNTPMRASVSVLIEGDDDDVVRSSVSADLSSLNPNLGSRRFDERVGDRYIWRNVEVTRASTCAVTVQATDTIGNKATQTLQCTMPIDSTGPQVEDIRTDIMDTDGKLVLPQQGSIYVELTDLDNEGNAGIGFQRRHVFLDLTQLGLSRKHQATNCTPTGATWTCEFAITPTASSGEYVLTLSGESRDDLDNIISNTMNREVIFDKDPPEIVSVNRFDIIHEGIRTQEIAVRGDTVEVEITASGSDSAVVDFTDIGLGIISAIQCDEDNATKNQRCLFTAVIEASGPYTADMLFTFVDLAGNEAHTALGLEVLGIEDEPNPNYWNVDSVDCSPKLVDRSLTDIINYPVYCHISLDPLSTGRAKLPGVMVHQLLPGGAAEQAGLHDGDILTKYNSEEIADVRDMLRKLGTTNPAQSIPIEYRRNGTLATGQVKGGPFGSRFRTHRAQIDGTRIIAADIANFATDCTGDLSGYVADIGMINNNVGTKNPIMTVRLATTDFNVNQINFTCPVRIFSQVGDKFTQNPEIEDISVTIPFYNQPLGTYAGNIDRSVDRAVERAEDFLSWMDDITTILEYADLICTAWNTLVNVLTALGSIISVLGIASAAAKVIPGGQGISDTLNGAAKNICSPTETIRTEVSSGEYASYVNKFCQFLSCQIGLLDLTDAADITDGAGASWRSGSNEGIADFLTLNYGDTGTGYTQVLSNDIQGGNPSGDLNGPQAAQPPSTYLNVKDSLIYSVVIPPLCIPGILHNLNKLRQIECRYALCMSRDVRNGLPASTCNDAKHYQVCRFVTGEIFNIIPFAPIVSHYMNTIQNLASDPLVLAVTIVGRLLDCKAACSTPEGTGPAYIACAGLYILDLVGKSVATISQIADNDDLVSGQSNQWCNELEDWQDDLQQNQQQGTPGATEYGAI